MVTIAMTGFMFVLTTGAISFCIAKTVIDKQHKKALRRACAKAKPLSEVYKSI
jgi:hypothetical protein